MHPSMHHATASSAANHAPARAAAPTVAGLEAKAATAKHTEGGRADNTLMREVSNRHDALLHKVSEPKARADCAPPHEVGKEGSKGAKIRLSGAGEQHKER